MTASSSSQCQTAQTDLGRVGKGARRQRATSPHRTNARAVPTSRQMPEPSRPNSGTDLASRVTRGHGAQERAFAHPKFSFALYSLSLLLSVFFSFRCPFARGVRSAGGAWMPATHPDRHAMTGMQTPLSIRSRATPALRSLRTAGKPRRAIDLRNRANPIASRRPAFPATETLALRRSTWDFWPGPVLAVVRHALRDRTATSYAARVIVTRRSGSREPPRCGR